MKRILIFVLSGMLLAVNGAHAALETLAVSTVKPLKNLVADVARAGKLPSMNRVVEGLDGQLINSINATRKFRIVSRSDLDEVRREREANSSTNEMAKSDYCLVTTLDNFEDDVQNLSLDGGATVAASKRMVKVSIVAKIYNSKTAELLESVTVPVLEQNNQSSSDDLLVFVTREAADKIAARVVDVIFPAKVLDKTGKTITINRGDGTGIVVGQLWNVFAVGKELKDPDTGEVLGRSESLVGKAKINSVLPKFSTAELLEDNDVTNGAIVRPQLPQ